MSKKKKPKSKAVVVKQKAEKSKILTVMLADGTEQTYAGRVEVKDGHIEIKQVTAETGKVELGLPFHQLRSWTIKDA